ncbi:MAG: caspase family protein, partial [Gemmatimonadota bacterium]|nr:caspase family protein [Gemmatimonadota bacterium]
MPPPAAGTPARRALLIGIDAYRAPERALTGCVNDVELMRDVLVEHFQFPAENVTLITNELATRLGILQGLESLLQSTGRDDNVVIHYAGHGSQMTDREGDEPSGLDSTWHTVDSNAWDASTQQWVGENRDITDDEIAIWIERFAERTQYLTIVVDACHSGSISRDAGETRARGSTPDTRPVSELPPSPIGALPKREMRSASGWGAPAQSFVLISGCRDEERSMEVNPSPDAGRDKPHGALTWFLTKNLKESESGTTYRDVFEMATAQVTREIPGQHPQMEGRVDRTIFGISDLPAQVYRLITARNDRGEVTLRGGAAHGVTAGSRYAVYAAGSRQFAGSTATRLGEIVVTTVRATTSIAQVVDQSEA